MKALIIIDMFNADVSKRKDKNKLISNQLKLISTFKKKGHKVILTKGKLGAKANPVMNRLWGDEYAPKKGNKKEKRDKFLWNISIIDALKKTNPDKIISKEAYSAFYNTDLEKYCKKNKVNELYFCGISSGCCVYFSGVDAVYRRIQPFLVTDASTRTTSHSLRCSIALSTTSLIFIFFSPQF
ncbi:MAG: cysteine hydrolase [Nanoarchaeota archaeon]|nr:cysteine hydrolase [Nanoarchaeota archaeon]MBU1028493.1 cysteine hydrolase [Nanoarchaeota archaeon]